MLFIHCRHKKSVFRAIPNSRLRRQAGKHSASTTNIQSDMIFTDIHGICSKCRFKYGRNLKENKVDKVEH